MSIPSEIIETLQSQEVIAYPAEGVWGLGCDPFSEVAVTAVYALKNRSQARGFILLISDWDMLKTLTIDDPAIRWDAVKHSWPGAVTWVFPASDRVPEFLQEDSGGIALRMPNQSLLQNLLRAWGKPLLSTSANESGGPACLDEASVQAVFPNIACLSGELGDLEGPTPLYDAVTGKQLR